MSIQTYLQLVEDVNARGRFKPEWDSLFAHTTPAWFCRSKFGLFIHWGAFTVPEAFNEWYPRHMYRKGSPEYEHFRANFGDLKTYGYKDLLARFTAPRFNAAEWLDLFVQSGAQYITPVAEHHDGFQMYASELSEWNCAKKGPCRDVLGELKEEAEKRGIVFCTSSHRAEHYWFLNGGRAFDSDVNDPANDAFYGPAVFSADLNDDVQPKNMYAVSIDSPRMREHCENWLARTCELVEKYRPRMIYFDWWICSPPFKPYLKKFAAYYYNRAEEWGIEVAIDYKLNSFAYGTALFDLERGQTSGIHRLPWQSDTATAKNSWCYTKNNEWKRASDVVCDLVDIVSKNGNLMLNVGPRADGSICPEEQEILRGIGGWLRRNGEAIYGATPWKQCGEGPTKIPEGQFTDTDRSAYTPQDLRFTCKGGCVYVFVMSAQNTRSICVHAMRRQGAEAENETLLRASVLGKPSVGVAMRRAEEGLVLELSEPLTDTMPVCIKIEID